MSKKILLTGASGYIGSSILKFLIKKNYKIFALYFRKKKDFINHKNVKYICCDLTLKKKLKTIFQNYDFDTIINLAALKDYKKKNSKDILKKNISIQKNILENCTNKSIKLFIYFSSISVYENIKKKNFKENYSIKPKSFYSLAKLQCEKMLYNFSKKKNMNSIVLRISGAHGGKRKTGVVYKIFNDIINMKEIKLDNYNTRFRLIFLDDINHAINQILKIKPKKNFLTYNLAGKETYDLLYLINKIKNVLNVKSVKINKNKNKNYKNSKVLNIRKFILDYHYSPNNLKKNLKIIKSQI